MLTLGQTADSFRTGPFGSALHQSDYIEGGIPVVNPTHMHAGSIRENPLTTVSEEVAARLAAYRLQAGNIVFSRRGELGRCALVAEREVGWICGTGSIRVEVNRRLLNPEFLSEALQLPWVGQYLSLASVGSTMQNLNTGVLKSLPVVVPPLDEQSALVAKARAERNRVDQVATAATREVSLMREYRSRLVSDVVTGKLDVREAAARLPTVDVAEDRENVVDAPLVEGGADGEEELAEVES